MELTIILVFIIGFGITAVLTPILMRRPSQKKRYENMDDRKLVETNVQSKTMKQNLRIAAYLAVVSFLPLTVLLRQKEILATLSGYAIFLFISCLSASRFFREVENLTTTEIEYRKFKKDKEGERH